MQMKDSKVGSKARRCPPSDPSYRPTAKKRGFSSPPLRLRNLGGQVVSITHRLPEGEGFQVCFIDTTSDYDNVFNTWLSNLIFNKLKSGKRLLHNKFELSAGPYRSCSVSWEQDKEEPHKMRVDCYSVCRHSGGPEHNDEFIAAL